MIIREATEDDILNIGSLCVENWKKLLVGLLDQQYLDSLTNQDGMDIWKEHLKTKGAKIYVAYENDSFLGYAALNEDEEINDCLYLDSLHVKESARGKGIGTKLIHVVGKYAYDNYKHMSICIVKGNDRAKKLYENLGAVHYKDFIDDFHGTGTVSQSEKLIWNKLDNFK